MLCLVFKVLFGYYFVRVDKNANLDILSFWKANQFWFLELASMVHDVLIIPIYIVASQSLLLVLVRE